MDSRFEDSLAYGCAISQIAGLNLLQPEDDTGLRSLVAQCREPNVEWAPSLFLLVRTSSIAGQVQHKSYKLDRRLGKGFCWRWRLGKDWSGVQSTRMEALFGVRLDVALTEQRLGLACDTLDRAMGDQFRNMVR